MNEFEWRRQLRDLRQPLAPQRNLWSSIEASLDHPEVKHPAVLQQVSGRLSRSRKSWLIAGSLAASALLACGIAWRFQAPLVAPSASMVSSGWKPADPRLAGAAVELDAAQMELQLAIKQAPDSAALQRLLNRTHIQQTQLRLLASQAG